MGAQEVLAFTGVPFSEAFHFFVEPFEIPAVGTQQLVKRRHPFVVSIHCVQPRVVERLVEPGVPFGAPAPARLESLVITAELLEGLGFETAFLFRGNRVRFLGRRFIRTVVRSLAINLRQPSMGRGQ